MNSIKNIINKSEVLRYIIVGGGTYLVDFGSYYLLVSSGFHYIISDTINLPLVLGFNYLAHKLFTFKSSRKTKSELIHYLGNFFVLYIYSIGFLYLLITYLGTSPELAKIIQLITIPIINYFLLKKLVFRRK